MQEVARYFSLRFRMPVIHLEAFSLVMLYRGITCGNLIGQQRTMIKPLVQELFVLSTQQTLARQRPDGDIGQIHHNYLSILPWAICYSEAYAGNPYYKSKQVLDAIVRFGEFNRSMMDDHGAYAGTGWDEWRTLAWIEASQRLGGDLDPGTRRAWEAKFVACGKHVMAMATDMDVFEGAVPNHAVWDYALLLHLGRLFGVKAYTDTANHAMGRIIKGQTADGCFREGGTAGGFPGTQVTHYNLVSAQAVNFYQSRGGDAPADDALEKAWCWFYDFLLPDGSMPPTLDIRTKYARRPPVCNFPAYFINKPEGAWLLRRGMNDTKVTLARDAGDAYWAAEHRMLGFLGFQYDKLSEHVEPREPRWQPFSRMYAEEVCIHRQNGWAVVLSGMTNRFISSVCPQPFFGHERQDCVAIFHEKLGLISGTSHTKIDERLGTFVFYQDGNAQYIHDKAFLKSTPLLDTLLLQYGPNTGAVSLDTTKQNRCVVTFSLHGERGKRPHRGPGHAIAAFAAKAHLSLRLDGCESLKVGSRSWTAKRTSEEPLQLKIAVGETLDLGRWTISSPSSAWTLRWPVVLSDPYTTLHYGGEQVAVLETILYSNGHPTAEFHINVL